MKIGIIGAGAFTDFCLGAYRQHLKDIELVAITDLNLAAATALAKKYGITRVANDVTDLLADPAIGVVIILTPPNTHFELAQLALTAKKNILVEKPIAFNEVEARTLLELAEKNKLQMTANLVLRFHPFHQEIRKFVEEKTYGSLSQITTTALLAEYPADHWYWQPEISGGFFLNTFCHFIDLYSFITNQAPGMIGSSGDSDQGFLIAGEFGQTAVSLSANLHVSNEQEMVETVYVFDQAVVTTEGWLPESLTITSADGQTITKKSPEKIIFYQQLISRVLGELIDRVNGSANGVVKNETLYQAVSQPLKAQNQPLR